MKTTKPFNLNKARAAGRRAVNPFRKRSCVHPNLKKESARRACRAKHLYKTR